MSTRYNHLEVEEKWRKIWAEKKAWEVDVAKAKKPFYNLMMFPYPSAEGLHVGNMYAFTGSDIYGRFQRMRGYNVFEPMGFDAFGIHSENFAIKQGTHPAEQTAKNVEHFAEQLSQMGAIFAWDHKVNTTDPSYYKWTQWIFVQLFKAGLAYRAKAAVDWCPSCKTVLADEQVVSGRCERCDSEVIQKQLEQWFFKITKYAERLLKNLETIDWSERTKTAQRNWIGKSEGAEIEFPVVDSDLSIRVFTTRPDTLFGATYVVVSPEHEMMDNLLSQAENRQEVESYVAEVKKKTELERTDLAREKTGVRFKGVFCLNPATGDKIPVFVADYVLASYGTGAVMAVPAHDVRDRDFALNNANAKYEVKVKHVIDPGDDYNLAYYDTPFLRDESISGEEALEMDYKKVRVGEVVPFSYIGPGILMNSGKFNGMDSEKAKWEITKDVQGEKKTTYHLRDWLISRQRYWGPPIPIIYCESCGTLPVPEKDLPVLLPELEDFQPKGQGVSPLAQVEEFVKTTCPECGKEARRETDVSDTFLDSAWYFLRYPSTAFDNVPFDTKLTEKWLPVDMYIGGQEHAVLHLMYARFITMALHDLGHLKFEEPFAKFRPNGLLVKEGAKMSKSKGNVVNPDEYFASHGADTVRMYLMFLGPFMEGGDWSDQGIQGIFRFLHRVWNMVQGAKDEKSSLDAARNRTIKKVTEDISELRYNTAIAALMEYSNAMAKNPARKDAETLLVLLAPFAPHITSELWEVLGHKESVHDQSWPSYDTKHLKEDTVNMVVQVGGKVRDAIEVSPDISQKEAEKLARASQRVAKWIEGEPQKVIFVKGKLINFVV